MATTKLAADVFGVEVHNHELLKKAYNAYLANARQASATTKQRGEVRGGGKKPWKQKGTGRARFGSSRNPIWRGGGVVFGPRGNENYTITLPKHEKRTALRQALSLANQAGKLHILPYEDKVTGKTKDAVAFLEQQGFDRKTLLVASKKTPELMRSTNNLQNVLVLNAMYLSVYHILNADHIVLSPEAVEIVTAWLGKEEA
ncbi:50S ribosomal protein L4 [Candidatus Saccharibacteria bacterium]|nr:50S ribosomal protein L4 [Candidatus Saccharibacteria bacterium]